MTWRVFYSYVQQDSDLRDGLGTHLAPLVRKKQISEWDEREILPGTDWERAISKRLDSADLIILLLSADYLASEYCFGAEMERALTRLKRGEIRVLPVLLKPCLWQDSLFSELQIVPRDETPISSSSSVDEALHAVATEIREIVSLPPPRSGAMAKLDSSGGIDPALALIARQLHSYARIYERTRQRMRASAARTARMERTFGRMRTLAAAASPLLRDLATSPSPGDRLAAVAILQSFAVEEFLPFLVRLVESDQPFVGYHALLALQFAVDALEPNAYPELSRLLQEADSTLEANEIPPDSERRVVLVATRKALGAAQKLFLGKPAQSARRLRRK